MSNQTDLSKVAARTATVMVECPTCGSEEEHDFDTEDLQGAYEIEGECQDCGQPLHFEVRVVVTAKSGEPFVPAFEVGDRATHVSGGLDSREVAEVSADGLSIRLTLLAKVSDWLPAENYYRTGAEQ